MFKLATGTLIGSLTFLTLKQVNDHNRFVYETSSSDKPSYWHLVKHPFCPLFYLNQQTFRNAFLNKPENVENIPEQHIKGLGKFLMGHWSPHSMEKCLPVLKDVKNEEIRKELVSTIDEHEVWEHPQVVLWLRPEELNSKMIGIIEEKLLYGEIKEDVPKYKSAITNYRLQRFESKEDLMTSIEAVQ